IYFFLPLRSPPTSTLFPYTTLFRSHHHAQQSALAHRAEVNRLQVQAGRAGHGLGKPAQRVQAGGGARPIELIADPARMRWYVMGASAHHDLLTQRARAHFLPVSSLSGARRLDRLPPRAGSPASRRSAMTCLHSVQEGHADGVASDRGGRAVMGGTTRRSVLAAAMTAS